LDLAQRSAVKVLSTRFVRIVLVLGVVALGAACGGDSSTEVTLEDIVNEDFDGGDFSATGSVICDSGETNSLDFDVTETLWWYESEFTCADGSGAFVLRAELPPPPDPDTEAASEPLDGTWTVQSGSGDYSNLEGSGTVTADPEPAIVTYAGEMTNG